MRKLISFIIALVYALTAQANPVDRDRAAIVAHNWLTHQIFNKGLEREVQIRESHTREVDGMAVYYVFDFEPEGFVFVAGNDASSPILGYSPRGSSGWGTWPENFRFFLERYVRDILEIHEKAYGNEKSIEEWKKILNNEMPDKRNAPAVEPLLFTRWGQSRGETDGITWNSYCPADAEGPDGRTVVGCVAVAMGQVMRYWAYPQQGIGSNSYSLWSYGEISADFGATTYDWNDMRNNVPTESSAELLFHLGVSVKMRYGPDGSSAFSNRAVNSLIDHFSYHPDAELKWKAWYTTNSWINLLKSQLDMGRPLYYAGSRWYGGRAHAFNCDGYDANDLFHFNWGWGGTANGYYAIGELNPQTISHDNGQIDTITHNFNWWNHIIYNLHPAEKPSPEGSGTAADPYRIASLNDIFWLSNNPGKWDKHYVQTAHIDATGTQSWFGGAGFRPIGQSLSNAFTGTYDGQGHTIENLSVNRPGTANVGFFGYTNGATIRNLGLNSVDIRGGNSAGSLVGYANNTTVDECYGKGFVGGAWDVGGLIGISYESEVQNSYAATSVHGTGYIGGLVGFIESNSTIAHCYSKGRVSCTTGNSGGFAAGIDDSSSDVSNYWNTTTSLQTSSAAGLGRNTSQMTYPYATNTYQDYDFEMIWQADIHDLNNGYPFLRWQRFAPIAQSPRFGNGSSAHPYRIESMENLYWIAEDDSRWAHYYIQTHHIDASSSKLVYHGAGWKPIGTSTGSPFTGSYNGGGHAIEGLYVNRPDTDYVGLFGATSGATIQNAGLIDVDITGNNHVGGLAGFAGSGSTIGNSYVTGTIQGGFAYAGGLVGRNSESTVQNSYSEVDVSGYEDVGGLVGRNVNAIINNSYSMSSVTGSSFVGGLLGDNRDSEVTDSYATSFVSDDCDTNCGGLIGAQIGSTTTNSYWNTETSGQSFSAGGEGRTTAEMTYPFGGNTFASWDFVETWHTDAGHDFNNGYPYHQWRAEYPPFSLPFSEDWSSGDFDTNKWQVESHWKIDFDQGDPAPSALFEPFSTVWNYSRSLTSHPIDGSNNKCIKLSIDLSFAGEDMSSRELLDISLYYDAGWQTVASFNNQGGDFPWTTFEYNISRKLVSEELMLRFRASGQRSSNISHWGIDNIVIEGHETPAPFNLIAEADQHRINLHWLEAGAPQDHIMLRQHSNNPITGYIQEHGMGYGVVFDLEEHPGATLETIDFRHSSYGLSGTWEYKVHIVNWVNFSVIESLGPFISTQDEGWELDVDLGGIAPGTQLVGILIEPLGNEADDAYPVLDGDAYLQGYSVVASVDQPLDYELSVAGDFLIDLWIQPSSREAVIAAQMLSPGTQDTRRAEGDLLPDDRIRTRRGERSPDKPEEELSKPSYKRGLLGYNVYRNGQLLNQEPLTTTQYADYEVSGGSTYSYNVQAVYEHCLSSPSNTVEIRPLFFSRPPLAGDGSETYPYHIQTLDNLYWLSADPGRWQYHYIQVDDIDASLTMEWHSGQGWTPLGYFIDEYEYDAFTGSYDGQGHAIEALFIDRPSENGIGFFGFTDAAQISRLSILEANFTGNDYAGIMAGAAINNSVFNKVKTSGQLNGRNVTGGISGYLASSRIENSHNHGMVNGSDYTGGLAGLIGPGGTAKAGLNGSEDLESGFGDFSKDLTGSSIKASCSHGSVSGQAYVGGIAGSLLSSAIINSYSSGSVIGAAAVGGLAGLSYFSSFHHCYSWASVAGNEFTGGLIAIQAESSATRSYWNTDVSGQETSALGMGRTTAQMTYPYEADTYYEWDFFGIWAADAHYINDGYPHHRWQNIDITPVATAPLAGDGSSEDPYQVENLENLYWITINHDRWGYHYIQTADIDATETQYWFGGEGWIPIGCNSDDSEYTRFTGNYDGQEHIISGLNIHRPETDNTALFGVSDGATIKNLSVLHVAISGHNNTAALSGQLTNNTAVHNCFTSGHITGNNLVGGLAGYALTASSIDNSGSSVSLSGNMFTGGLVGFAYDASISRTFASGQVHGVSLVGGLLGAVELSEVTNSYSTAWVTASGDYAGGFTGRNGQSAISHSYAIGWVTGSELTGGFAGYAVMTGDYADINNYWNTISTGETGSAMGEGRTRSQMTYAHDTDTYVGWDFDDTWFADYDHSINDGYPFLMLQHMISPVAAPPAGGDGTQENPYMVATLANLYWIAASDDEVPNPPRAYRWQAHYVQVANIDARVTSNWFGGEGWIPIGTFIHGFTGSYDGVSHAIDGLYVNRESSNDMGLFGYVNGGSISNLGLTNVDVTGAYFVGGLAGGVIYESEIHNCFVSGNISGNSWVGGLTGECYESLISKSFANTHVTGHNNLGGLVGRSLHAVVVQSFSEGSVISTADIIPWSKISEARSIQNDRKKRKSIDGSYAIGGLAGETFNAIIENCYSRADVEGGVQVGGLAGDIANTEISHSFSTGVVNGDEMTGGLVGSSWDSSFNQSYWDTETSGQEESAGGYGRESTKMTYPYASDTFETWDFVHTWSADENHSLNDGYPCLQWQIPEVVLYKLSLEVQPEGAGVAEGAGHYEAGSVITLSATANEGFAFYRWSEEEGFFVSDEAVFDFTMPPLDHKLVANFIIVETPEHLDLSNLTITADDPEMCYDALQTITVSNLIIKSGGSVNLIAGENIILLPGTRVYHGGHLHAYISNVFCGSIPRAVEEKVEVAEVPMLTRTAENLHELSFKVYPNPTDGYFTIEPDPELVTIGGEMLRVNVYAIDGRLVFSKESIPQAQQRICLTDQKAGLYIIHVRIGAKAGVTRLIRK